MGEWGYGRKGTNRRWGWAHGFRQNVKGLECLAKGFGCHGAFIMREWWWPDMVLREITLEACQGWAWKGENGSNKTRAGSVQQWTWREKVSFQKHFSWIQLVINCWSRWVSILGTSAHHLKAPLYFMYHQGRGGKWTNTISEAHSQILAQNFSGYHVGQSVSVSEERDQWPHLPECVIQGTVHGYTTDSLK